MTAKDVRLKYKQESGYGDPYNKNIADLEYVQWLEQTIIDLTEEIEGMEIMEIMEIIHLQ